MDMLDVMESIFAFCSLKEIAALMAVSHSWQSSVLRMRPIEGRFSVASSAAVQQMCASRLSRHVVHLKQHNERALLKAVPFNLLSLYMPHLQSIDAVISCAGFQPLLFPSHLRQLKLSIGGVAVKSPLPSDLQATLASIAQLAELEQLTLGDWIRQVSLSPLLTMPQLRSLHLYGIHALNVSMNHLEVLRQLHQLHELVSPVSLAQLLAPGHRLRLRTFESDLATQVECDALATMPLLTRVKLNDCECAHVDSLTQLPQLQHLTLSFRPSAEQPVNSPRIVAALSQCSQLTALTVNSWDGRNAVFTSEQQLRDCLQSLPLLRSLDVSGCRNISSLSFLTSGPVTTTLTRLRLARFSPRLPVTELQHLLHLRSLERVDLVRLFERDLTSEEVAPFTPPSQLMPTLRSCFSYHG